MIIKSENEMGKYEAGYNEGKKQGSLCFGYA